MPAGSWVRTKRLWTEITSRGNSSATMTASELGFSPQAWQDYVQVIILQSRYHCD